MPTLEDEIGGVRGRDLDRIEIAANGNSLTLHCTDGTSFTATQGKISGSVDGVKFLTWLGPDKRGESAVIDPTKGYDFVAELHRQMEMVSPVLPPKRAAE